MTTRSSTSSMAAAGLRARGVRGHKERSKNFSELEKRTVLELIAQHRDILRQGRSNNATNKNKQLVWSTICAEVNKRCGSDRPRTPAQVKMWYENYKKKCKMRAIDPQDGSNILDGMLWRNIHPYDIKDEDERPGSLASAGSKEDDCPVNMSNGRLSSCPDGSDISPHVLEPHIQIIQNSSPPHSSKQAQSQIFGIKGHTEVQDYTLKNYQEDNVPLNLSNLDSDSERRNSSDYESRKFQDTSTKFQKPGTFVSEEEKLFFMAKRQHAIWEHEAKMKILNMELRQKEEIFSLQKQLFLIELKLKMDFLEKACGAK